MPIIHQENGIPPSKSKLINVGADYPDDVASGNTITKTYTPPVGMIWEVVNMFLYVGAPAGAAMGAHSFKVYVGDRYSMFGQSGNGTWVEWSTNMWVKADSSQQPATEVGALLAMQNIIADADNPLIVDYYNATDVTQANTVKIHFIVKETPVI